MNYLRLNLNYRTLRKNLGNISSTFIQLIN